MSVYQTQSTGGNGVFAPQSIVGVSTSIVSASVEFGFNVYGLATNSVAVSFAIGVSEVVVTSITELDITRIVQAVLTALHATTIPVSGNWPTALQIADTTLNNISNTVQSVNVVSVKGVPVVGAGTKSSPWSPA